MISLTYNLSFVLTFSFQSKWRATLFDFVGTKQFELFIMSVIIANMLTMMIQHYDQSKEVEVALEYLNYLFTGIFTIEAIIRLIAMRLEYFKSFMNIFDFSVVIVSIGGKWCFHILIRQFRVESLICRNSATKQ